MGAGSHKYADGEIKVDGRTIGYSAFSWSPTPAYNVVIAPPTTPHDDAEMSIDEAKLHVRAYLFVNPEGATAAELREALKFNGNALAFGVMLDLMVTLGELIEAREPREVAVKWEISADIARAPNGRFVPSSEKRMVEHIEKRPVFRLSPEAWIEMAS